MLKQGALGFLLALIESPLTGAGLYAMSITVTEVSLHPLVTLSQTKEEKEVLVFEKNTCLHSEE